jgi:hypothetical protein
LPNGSLLKRKQVKRRSVVPADRGRVAWIAVSGKRVSRKTGRRLLEGI